MHYNIIFSQLLSFLMCPASHLKFSAQGESRACRTPVADCAGHYRSPRASSLLSSSRDYACLSVCVSVIAGSLGAFNDSCPSAFRSRKGWRPPILVVPMHTPVSFPEYCLHFANSLFIIFSLTTHCEWAICFLSGPWQTNKYWCAFYERIYIPNIFVFGKLCKALSDRYLQERHVRI